MSQQPRDMQGRYAARRAVAHTHTPPGEAKWVPYSQRSTAPEWWDKQTPLTQTDLHRMSADQITEAYHAGALTHLL